MSLIDRFLTLFYADQIVMSDKRKKLMDEIGRR